MTENLKFSPQGAPCTLRKDECVYTWAEAMNADNAYNHREIKANDPNNYQGLCPAGWRVPNENDAEEMLYNLKIMSGTSLDEVFFCNSIIREELLAFSKEKDDFIHDDFCDTLSNADKSNGFNMHMSGPQEAALWLLEEEHEMPSTDASCVIFISHRIRVYSLGAMKINELGLRCVMDISETD